MGERERERERGDTVLERGGWRERENEGGGEGGGRCTLYERSTNSIRILPDCDIRVVSYYC